VGGIPGAELDAPADDVALRDLALATLRLLRLPPIRHPKRGGRLEPGFVERTGGGELRLHLVGPFVPLARVKGQPPRDAHRLDDPRALTEAARNLTGLLIDLSRLGQIS